MTSVSSLRKIAEGREAEIFAWEDGTVLRLLRNPDGRRQLEWEAAAMRAAAAGVRVPTVHGLETVDGRPGLVMERIDGVDLLTIVGKKPWTVWEAGRVSGRLHAQLHNVVAPDTIPELRPILRQRIEQSPLVPPQIAKHALSVLDTLPDGDRICHGDFHPGNVIANGDQLVVIDWTNVRRGDPTADFARTDLMIRIGDVPPGSAIVVRVGAVFARGLMRRAYLRAYGRLRPIDRELAARWFYPVAANRLTEEIEPERAKLLKLLREAS